MPTITTTLPLSFLDATSRGRRFQEVKNCDIEKKVKMTRMPPDPMFSFTFLLSCLLLLLPLLPTCQSCKASAPTSTSSTPAADIRSGKFLREEVRFDHFLSISPGISTLLKPSKTTSICAGGNVIHLPCWGDGGGDSWCFGKFQQPAVC